MKNFFRKKLKVEKSEQSPGFLMWQASTLWRRKIEQCLEHEKLSHSAFVMLAVTAFYTSEYTEELTQKKLAELSCLDPNVVSQMLKKLMARGLMDRAPSVRDERAKAVTLTDTGCHLLESLKPQIEAIDREIFGTECATFCTSLSTIIRQFE